MAKLTQNGDIIQVPTNKEKFRGWAGITYLESMIEGWQDKAPDIIQYPYAYTIHDKDIDKETGELKKGHIHWGVYFTGPTTYTRALKLFKELQPTCATCKPIKNLRYYWDYLIHDTETAKKEGKHLYLPEERITGNGWNIEDLAPMTPSEKKEASLKLANFIRESKITNFIDFYEQAIDTFGTDAYSVIKADAYLFNCLIKGNFNKYNKVK